MKLNFTIDASGIFYRSLYTVGNFGVKKGEKLLSSEESKGIFIRKLATDFAALIKSVENINRVIICLDSSSWRKQIPIENGGYKLNREDKKEEESNIDWESFFQITSEFTEIMGSKGYILSKIKNAEADDLLYLWSRALNKMGESVILVTGDKDLHQVIQTCENGTFTVVLDPVAQRRKIFLTKSTLENRHHIEPEDVSSIDLFNPDTWNSSSGDILENLLDKNDHFVLDPIEVATRKVLLGDNGDNVPSVVTWLDAKDPTKTRAMTETKLNKVLAVMPKMTWQSLKTGEFAESFTENVNKLVRPSFVKPYLPKDIQAKIERNIKLVVLDTETIPSEIQEAFDKKAEQITSSPIHMAREQILEGTKWWTQKKAFVPSGYSINFDGASDDSPFMIVPGELKVIAGIPNFKKDSKNSSPLF
jgi:5'-3' exonuclease